MKKNLTLWVIILLLTATSVIVVVSALNIFSWVEYSDYDYPTSSLMTERGGFIINPETILESLKNGETDVFVPNMVRADGELPNVVYEKPIVWTQEEHLSIAEAVSQFNWKDTLRDWDLYEMGFILNCRENLNGFEQSYMTYFKEISDENGDKAYTVRSIAIVPKSTYVEWGGGAEFSIPLFGWKNIDQDRLRINAEKALTIAEENGGRNARLRFNNECRVRVFLEPQMYPDGWQIWYEVGGRSQLKITIDPFTGKIIK